MVRLAKMTTTLSIYTMIVVLYKQTDQSKDTYPAHLNTLFVGKGAVALLGIRKHTCAQSPGEVF